jgi:hypothetical protein
MEREKEPAESSSALPWTREEDGYIISTCKEKLFMEDWRAELRDQLPGRTRDEILKRVRYLGLILKKRRIVKSEGDDVGQRMRIYAERYQHLTAGSEDEVDAARAIAHLEAYQRAAEGVKASDSEFSDQEAVGPEAFGFETPPPDGDQIDGTYTDLSHGTSEWSPLEESEGVFQDSVADSEAGGGRGGGRSGVDVVRWTEEEDAKIRKGVEAGQRWRKIAEGLPGRTTAATAGRGCKLGLNSGRWKQRKPWRADEEATVRACVAAGEKWRAIAGKLPGRDENEVRYCATRLGLESPRERVPWTEAEDEEIRGGAAAGESCVEIAARLPGRTLAAVKKRRSELGPKEGEGRVTERWTEAEDAALREGFASGKQWKEIAKALPTRTESAVRTRGTVTLGLSARAARAARHQSPSG